MNWWTKRCRWLNFAICVFMKKHLSRKNAYPNHTNFWHIRTLCVLLCISCLVTLLLEQMKASDICIAPDHHRLCLPFVKLTNCVYSWRPWVNLTGKCTNTCYWCFSDLGCVSSWSSTSEEILSIRLSKALPVNSRSHPIVGENRPLFMALLFLHEYHYFQWAGLSALQLALFPLETTWLYYPSSGNELAGVMCALLVLFSALVGRLISLFGPWVRCISHPRRPKWLFMCGRCLPRLHSEVNTYPSQVHYLFSSICLEASVIKITHIKAN